MSVIKHDDGQYALDCWLDEDDEGDPVTEYSETIAPLKARAGILLKAGRYKYLELSRWNADKDDWDNLEIFTPD